MTMPTAESDSTRTINWATTAIGTFGCSWAFLAWLRTTGQKVKLPIVEEVTITETLIFSIPLVFVCLALLYVLAIKHGRMTKPSQRLERIPPAFGLPLAGEMASFRLVVLVLFFMVPTASLVHFLIRFLRLEITSTANGRVLRGKAIFSFPIGWYNGEQWRWVSDNVAIRPSAFPGAQPLCYVALVSLSVLLLLTFIILIVRRPAPSGNTALSIMLHRVRRRIHSLEARIAVRFAGPVTLLRVGVTLTREFGSGESRRARFKLARAIAYLDNVQSAIALDRSGAAYGYFLSGHLQAAVELLEEKRHSDSAALVHWKSLTRIKEHCQKQNDYHAALELAVCEYRRQILGDLASTIFEELPGCEWPPVLTDFTAYFAASPKLIDGWVSVRDHNLLREVSPERLRALRNIAAKVHDPMRLDEIVLDFAVLLHSPH